MPYWTQKEIREFVEAKKEGEIEKTYGPSQLGSAQVWELWVFHVPEGEYFIRIVFDDGQSAPQYFSEFQQFCVFVNTMLARSQSEIRDLTNSTTERRELNHQKQTILLVASFVFVACAIALLALIFLDRAQGISGFALLGGLIASGGKMFYGEWMQPKLPNGGTS